MDATGVMIVVGIGLVLMSLAAIGNRPKEKAHDADRHTHLHPVKRHTWHSTRQLRETRIPL